MLAEYEEETARSSVPVPCRYFIKWHKRHKCLQASGRNTSRSCCVPHSFLQRLCQWSLPHAARLVPSPELGRGHGRYAAPVGSDVAASGRAGAQYAAERIARKVTKALLHDTLAIDTNRVSPQTGPSRAWCRKSLTECGWQKLRSGCTRSESLGLQVRCWNLTLPDTANSSRTRSPVASSNRWTPWATAAGLSSSRTNSAARFSGNVQCSI